MAEGLSSTAFPAVILYKRAIEQKVPLRDRKKFVVQMLKHETAGIDASGQSVCPQKN
jgi:hypothetical protein